MQAIADAALPAWPALDEASTALLRRCLAKAPADRFPDAAALRASLRALGPVADGSELAAWVGSSLRAR